MKCPICNIDLQMTDRQGIEIDYCSNCRGVWLDRGELDKLIERSTSREAAYSEDLQRHGNRTHDSDYGEYRKHKKKSMWREIFDFD